MTRLVLASASPARLRVLRSAGFDPEVVVSGVPEDDVDVTDVAWAVLELAGRKARAVAADPRAAGALVIGCDSLLDVDGVARGKPRSAAEARAGWESIRGRSATLRTGHHLVDTASGDSVGAVASTVVRFSDLTDCELRAYIGTGEPLLVAGGFTLEGRSGPFVDGVEGDPSNVLGLSLPLFRRLLAMIGYHVSDLWR